jgi:hypothetical protein
MKMSGQLHTPAALLPKKETVVHIGREAGWAPEPVWTRWWGERIPVHCGELNTGRRARYASHYTVWATAAQKYYGRYEIRSCV